MAEAGDGMMAFIIIAGVIGAALGVVGAWRASRRWKWCPMARRWCAQRGACPRVSDCKRTALISDRDGGPVDTMLWGLVGAAAVGVIALAIWGGQ